MVRNNGGKRWGRTGETPELGSENQRPNHLPLGSVAYLCSPHTWDNDWRDVLSGMGKSNKCSGRKIFSCNYCEFF